MKVALLSGHCVLLAATQSTYGNAEHDHDGLVTLVSWCIAYELLVLKPFQWNGFSHAVCLYAKHHSAQKSHSWSCVLLFSYTRDRVLLVLQASCLFSVCKRTEVFTGVVFCGDSNNDVAAVSYDTEMMHIWKMRP